MRPGRQAKKLSSGDLYFTGKTGHSSEGQGSIGGTHTDGEYR